MFGFKKDRSVKEKKEGYFSRIIGFKRIGSNVDSIKTIASYTLSPARRISEAKVETFDEAVKRHNVSDHDIAKILRNFNINFLVFLFFFSACLLGSVYNLNEGNKLSAIAMISIAFICFTLCVKFSFRAYQIRIRELCDFKKWFENKREWIPY